MPLGPGSGVFRPNRISGSRTALLLLGAGALVAGGLIPGTEEDFHVAGTQLGGVPDGVLLTSPSCQGCHGTMSAGVDPYTTWSGSLMAHAGRDPLFEAQMVTANQDVAYAGYYCMRCHVPMSIPTGHALPPDGSARDAIDSDGVSCHFCHSMVDPVYDASTSPAQDLVVLEGLKDVPTAYGNAAFVLDPSGMRRGPRDTPLAAHATIKSSFFKGGEMCGTCHDVGNLCVSRQQDGTYAYNALGERSPSADPWEQFPLERTFTEWKLSAFANGGVDMKGRFGGTGGPVVSSCQDCHMPKTVGQACYWGPEYSDLARHDFAGASSWVLDIIGRKYPNDPNVDLAALATGMAAADDMLTRAATLTTTQECGRLVVRVTNESGHKIPTGHIEGRRIFVSVEFRGANGELLRQHGHYDPKSAHLDEASTVVYEMHVGLSEAAAKLTGYPAGATTHMALADVIEKDNRIPPRGFNNAQYEAGGAPAVGCIYQDGQHWSDTDFAIPVGAVAAQVTLSYQTVTRHYIEALRDGNHTDTKGQELFDLWLQSGKCMPIQMAVSGASLAPFVQADFDCDGLVSATDLARLFNEWGAPRSGLDLTGDGKIDGADVAVLLSCWSGG